MSGAHIIKILDCPEKIPHAEEQPFVPIPTPKPDDPTVRIGILQAGVLRMMSTFFCDGRDYTPEMWTNMPDFCFLVEHVSASGEKETILFDLGIRKGGSYQGPDHIKYYNNGGCTSSHGCGAALDQAGIPRSAINHIIVSHTHFDHVGDLSEFPASTALVLGPDGPEGQMLATELDVDLEEVTKRPVRHLSNTTDTWLDVASFRGVDFFGDGSLYIIDLPGHKAAHVGVLARTSCDPPVYHVMAADSCHSDIFFHPTKPKPRIAVFQVPGSNPPVMNSLFDDIPTSYVSLAKLQRTQKEPDIGVWTAHGEGLLKAFAGQGLEDGEIRWMKGDMEELKQLKALQTQV